MINCGHRSGDHHGDGVFDEFLGGRILEIGTPWKVEHFPYSYPRVRGQIIELPFAPPSSHLPSKKWRER